jgi:DNA-binding response OmpR family regulator
MKLILAKNEPNHLSILQKNFYNNAVSMVIGRETALQIINDNYFDVVILDIILQKTNGHEICKKLSTGKFITPVLILTSIIKPKNIATIPYKYKDYDVVKPPNFNELNIRANNLNRKSNYENDIITINDLEINGNTKTVKRDEQSIVLTAKEYKLLYFLARNKETIVSRWQILDNVWDIDCYKNINSVEVYISFLRKKIDTPFKNKLIHTIKWLGYTIRSY